MSAIMVPPSSRSRRLSTEACSASSSSEGRSCRWSPRGTLVRAVVPALTACVVSPCVVSPSVAEEPHGATLPALGADRRARGVAWRA
ncbi:hypothetical protein NKG05_00595 [Oerskovia sp. M15]